MLFNFILPFLTFLSASLNTNNVVFASSRSEMEMDEEDCMYMALEGECKTNPDMMKQSCGIKICHEWNDEFGSHDLNKISSFYDLSANDIDGNHVLFEDLRGKIVLIVNVASQCGYTEQHYKELVELYSELEGLAIEILAFPCNQFGKQEPDAPAQIKAFAKSKGVKFRMMEKTDVNGKDSHMVFKWLKNFAGPFKIEWNFATYYIIDLDGDVEEYSGITPLELKEELLMLLDQEEL